MDPTRDNPIIRFAAFWWALGTVLVFALVFAGIWFCNRGAPVSLEDVAAAARYQTRTRINQAQASQLDQSAIDAAISGVAQQLVTARPAAVVEPAQLVPGSPTAVQQAAKPAPASSNL